MTQLESLKEVYGESGMISEAEKDVFKEQRSEKGDIDFDEFIRFKMAGWERMYGRRVGR